MGTISNLSLYTTEEGDSAKVLRMMARTYKR